MLLENERRQIVEYGRRMIDDGLTSGTSGNISILDKEKGLIAITPSGIRYHDMKIEDVVVMDVEGKVVEGDRKPSSEKVLHMMLYKAKPEIRSIVHTHSMYCTVFASLRQTLKAIHYVIADAGVSEIPCAPYETFGSVELAEAVSQSVGVSNAALLANHGMVACGKSLETAYGLAKEMEYCAELQYRCLSIGNPFILSDEEVSRVMKKFGTYGLEWQEMVNNKNKL